MTCDVWPHFQGGYGQYFYLGANHAIFKLPDVITDGMAAGINCAFTQVYAALEIAGLKVSPRSGCHVSRYFAPCSFVSSIWLTVC